MFLPCVYVYGADDDALIMDKLSGDNGFLMSFEQKSDYKFIHRSKLSKGQLTFTPPSSFIWEINGENAGKVISNGKKTWIYSPADEEGDTPTVVVKKGIYEGVQSIFFDSKYKVSSLKKEGKIRLLKVNGGKSKGYMWAEVRFTDTPDFRIDSVVFEDVEGTKVTIKAKSFNRLSDKPVSGTFDFKVPKGARIIKK